MQGSTSFILILHAVYTNGPSWVQFTSAFHTLCTDINGSKVITGVFEGLRVDVCHNLDIDT